MRTHIVGTENRYYQSEEEADAGCTPTVVRQLVARANSDGKTWRVMRTTSAPVPGIKAVPMKLRVLMAIASAMNPLPLEESRVIRSKASLMEAYNLIRNDEEKPELVATLPALRQFNRPEDTHEYWRNMPQPR